MDEMTIERARQILADGLATELPPDKRAVADAMLFLLCHVATSLERIACAFERAEMARD